MSKKRGFTLIELMIVVAIIGILASVAIPSFLRFIKQGKASEAPLNLRSISNGAIAWFNDDHADSNGNPYPKHFPHYGAPIGPPTAFGFIMTPGDWPCVSVDSVGALYKKNTAHWNTHPWINLKFSITKAHYYRYSYGSNNTGNGSYFETLAFGDLDCDSTMGMFRLDGAVNSTTGEPELTELKRQAGIPPSVDLPGGDYLE